MTIAARPAATVGRNGRTILRLEADPTDATGRLGDSAIVVDGDGKAQKVYAPKTENGWPEPVSIPGSSFIFKTSALVDADDGIDGDFAMTLILGVLRTYGPKTAGAWGASTGTVRPQSILSGTADATGGDDGDYYFKYDSEGAAVSWSRKASGAWGSPHDMRGPSRAAIATVSVTADRTIGESDLGKCLVVDSASTVTLTFPDTIAEAGWSVLVRRKGAGAVILAAGSGATIAFQYVDDDRIAKVNGTVSVDNINGATAWVVSEGTADA